MSEKKGSDAKSAAEKGSPSRLGDHSASAHVCSICGENAQRYACPRCGISYCSTTCYRSERHSYCSEKFYEQEFCNSLRHTKETSSGRKKMHEILKKIEGEDHDQLSDSTIDTEQEEILRKALLDLDEGCNPEVVLNILNDEQKEEFGQIISGSKMESSLIETSKPWWIDAPLEDLERGELRLPNNDPVIEVRDPLLSGNSLLKYIERKMLELENMPSVALSIGSCKDPIPLFNNIIEIICSYVYCYIFVGTEFVVARDEGAQILQSLSNVLRQNSATKYMTPLEAWKGFLCNLEIFEERVVPSENKCAIMANVMAILSVKKKVLRALKEIWGLQWGAAKFKTPDASGTCHPGAIAMKIKFYYGLYRDCPDSKWWAHSSLDVLKVKQTELSSVKYHKESDNMNVQVESVKETSPTYI